MDSQMEIEEILTNMEEKLEQAKTVPFSDKVLVDREELYDMITDIRPDGSLRRRTAFLSRRSSRRKLRSRKRRKSASA